ncbi:DNA repair endonuclease UVH1 [Acorus gramineus]|uniref:DNA repair endonuclease UVH1 n=1 Tax=Acorus gramineus TaxID=55184 RepID=A0AAV9ADX4_ACOGR|nr:DNA repair endonuclease UVH1 [Acorus gramineus]
MLLPFQEQIISDLLEDPNGGLVVLSSGLSLPSLISSLLLLHSSSPQGTLLILSASDSQKHSIHNPNPNSPSDITSDLPPPHRASLYASSGAFFVTSRILTVDLLSSRVPHSSVAGLLILNAHSLSETSPEAFAVRLLRSTNPNCYVRAFSDRPHSMVAGFAKAERIMKCLSVRRLHLWPRFQVFVSGDLERDPPEVVDLRVPMSGPMRGIQRAAIEAMDACLKELRRTNKVDVEDLTVENGLFKSFDDIVRRQLDPIWHTLGRKTKQLVSDLRTLRKLVDYLVRFDAVTYLKYLDSLRVSEGVQSVWIFADSSHKIFELAKKRVYQLVLSDGRKYVGDSKGKTIKRRKVKQDNGVDGESGEGTTVSDGTGDVGTSGSGGVVLEEVLEEAPKWKVLREVLQEIEEERQKINLPGEGESNSKDVGDVGEIVLVACKDACSCMQLEDFITKGPQKVMREEWEKYLLGKSELHGFRKREKKKSQGPKGFGLLNGVVPVGSRENAKISSICRVEHDALMAAASEIRNLNKEEIAVEESSHSHATGIERKKGRGKGGMRKATTKHQPSRGKGDMKGVENNVFSSEKEDQRGQTKQKTISGPEEKLLTGVSKDKSILRKHDQEAGATECQPQKPLSPVQFYAIDSNQQILDIMKPSVIVVYHPDVAFVREIEVYKAQNPGRSVKVYFLFYEDSMEVQKFEASIRRENSAFESLIRQKSLMMIPVDQDGKSFASSSSNESQSLVSHNSVTRKAGGRKAAEKEMKIIVDMREFMSSLPNVLHQKGMHIIPVTLEVGDYILSPLICVERKSLSDLFQSFASGRLYNQVETMVRYYRIPVLLIEFSQDKSFSFQSASDIGDDVVPTSIISKLSLLVLHFPRLRLVWSRSLHATAEIFASLKANQDEPDESRAMKVGVPTEDGIVENDVRAENYNTSAVEFLRRLPGVTDSNYRAIMDGCTNLAELALLPVEKLAELMGSQKAAKTLREFLDAKCPTMF